MSELDNFRAKYPQYNDVNDVELSSMLATKFPDAYGDLAEKYGKKYIDNPWQKETGNISAITGKPETEYTSTGYKPPSMETLFKAGFIDNNDSRIKHFAEARGVSPDQYEVKNGKIWFQGNDGNMYPEEPKEIGQVLKRVLAQLPSEGLADAGAAAGAALSGASTGGLGTFAGAAAGAAGGEALRKLIGKFFFGDSQGVDDYALDMAIQGVFGGVDATIAKKMINKLSSKRVQKATEGKLTDDLGSVVADIPDADKVAAKTATGKAKNIGVDLRPDQALDDPTLTSYWEMLRGHPKTSRRVRASDTKLDNQTDEAGEALLRHVSDKETDPFDVGYKLQRTSNDAVQDLKNKRSDLAKPYYDKAKDIQVDVKPIKKKIFQLQRSTKPGMPVHNTLKRLERMLEGEQLSVEVVDNVKKFIDGFLSGPDAKSATRNLKRNLKQVKDTLTTQADQASPDYQKARKIFQLASPPVDKAESSVVGTLAKMKPDNIKETAINKVFKSRRSVQMAKKAIGGQDPELWKDTVAEYLRGSLEKVGRVAQGSGGKVLNRPGKYATIYDRATKKKLKLATEGMKDGNGDPLFNRVDDFFTTMQKASIGHNIGSPTQSRQQLQKSLEGGAETFKRVFSNFREASLNFMTQNRSEKAFDKNARNLLDLLQTPDGVDLIMKAKGYGPNTRKGLEALTTFMLMAAQGNAKEGYELGEAVMNK